MVVAPAKKPKPFVACLRAKVTTETPERTGTFKLKYPEKSEVAIMLVQSPPASIASGSNAATVAKRTPPPGATPTGDPPMETPLYTTRPVIVQHETERSFD